MLLETGAPAYDLVFMDLQMPGLDGLEVVRRFRRHVPVTSPPYIVALTANVRTEDRAAAEAAGMHDFVPKPISLADLRVLMERARTWLAAHR
jgi:CheY-like chemotaxis protein